MEAATLVSTTASTTTETATMLVGREERDKQMDKLDSSCPMVGPAPVEKERSDRHSQGSSLVETTTTVVAAATTMGTPTASTTATATTSTLETITKETTTKAASIAEDANATTVLHSRTKIGTHRGLVGGQTTPVELGATQLGGAITAAAICKRHRGSQITRGPTMPAVTVDRWQRQEKHTVNLFLYLQ